MISDHYRFVAFCNTLLHFICNYKTGYLLFHSCCWFCFRSHFRILLCRRRKKTHKLSNQSENTFSIKQPTTVNQRCIYDRKLQAYKIHEWVTFACIWKIMCVFFSPFPSIDWSWISCVVIARAKQPLQNQIIAKEKKTFEHTIFLHFSYTNTRKQWEKNNNTVLLILCGVVVIIGQCYVFRL